MNLTITRSAQKELDRLSDQVVLKISEKIARLSDNPFRQNSQKLAGGKGNRIRFGDYRIIYTVNSKKKEITVIKIGHRRDIYR
jgi:mRNA interferase RelE/StbE